MPESPPPPIGFTCPICGRSHECEPTDYGWSLPDIIWDLGEPARQEHLDWSTDIAGYKDRWFLRGVLETRFQFTDFRFGWGMWAEVSESTMATYYRVFNEDGSHLPPESGSIANALPEIYPSALGLEVRIQFGPADKRPTFTLPPDCPHLLASEQQQGLTIERYHEILAAIRS